MPLYEYQCTECSHRFEVLQRLSDDPIETCERCEKPVRKLLSSPAFQFKGSGFYETDYVKKKGDDGEGKKAKDGGDGDSKGTDKKDKKATGDAKKETSSSSSSAEKSSAGGSASRT